VINALSEVKRVLRKYFLSSNEVRIPAQDSYLIAAYDSVNFRLFTSVPNVSLNCKNFLQREKY
jgi:hypothetical protein